MTTNMPPDVTTKLDRYRRQHEKKLAQLQKAQSALEAMARKLQEEENTQIIAAMRRYSVSPEDVIALFQMLDEGRPPEEILAFLQRIQENRTSQQSEETEENDHEQDESM